MKETSQEYVACQVRKGRWLGLEQRGEQVSLQVVHANRRKPPGVCEAAREGGAGEQCPDEPRARRVGDPVQVLRLRARAFQCPSGQGQEPADVTTIPGTTRGTVRIVNPRLKVPFISRSRPHAS